MSGQIHRRAAVLGLGAAFGLAKSAPAWAPNLDASKIADLTFGAWLDQQGAPGGVLGVIRAGEPVVTWSHGVRALGDVQPDADTLYCIASVTKSLTAFGVLVLADEGKVNLDGSASTLLPELPESWRYITVRQFLCHASGIPRGLLQPTWEEALEAAAARPLAPPGERSRYNNFNYAVAGKLIERASGQSYAGFMKARVFEPLGMTRTRIGDAWIENRAKGYRREAGVLVEPALWPEAGPHYEAAGKAFSTLNDMLAFLNAVQARRLLSAERWRDMTRPYGPAARATAGWFSQVAGGMPYIEKLGRLSGYSTDAEFYPNGSALVMMWNLQASGDRSIQPRAALRKSYFGIGSGWPEDDRPSVAYEHAG
ncbi:MAG: serine hydrolase domain-containing protein [Caulobacteraceae bacterium]